MNLNYAQSDKFNKHREKKKGFEEVEINQKLSLN